MGANETTSRAGRVSPLTARLAIAFVAVALAAITVLTVVTLVAARGGVSQLTERQQQVTVERAATLAVAVASTEVALRFLVRANRDLVGLDDAVEVLALGDHDASRLEGERAGLGVGVGDDDRGGAAVGHLE